MRGRREKRKGGVRAEIPCTKKGTQGYLKLINQVYLYRLWAMGSKVAPLCHPLVPSPQARVETVTCFQLTEYCQGEGILPMQWRSQTSWFQGKQRRDYSWWINEVKAFKERFSAERSDRARWQRTVGWPWGAESRPQLRASKKRGTPVLQPPGTEFSQQTPELGRYSWVQDFCLGHSEAVPGLLTYGNNEPRDVCYVKLLSLLRNGRVDPESVKNLGAVRMERR